MTDGQWLSQYRREGRDWQFQWYLLGQHLRIFGAIIMRDAVAPVAIPILDWMARRFTR